MKCPLSPWVKGAFDDEELSTPLDCRKEECAWWIETQDRCALKDIALSLGFISTDITQILERR